MPFVLAAAAFSAFLLMSGPLLGQGNVKLDHHCVSYTSADGLPSSEIHEVFQDRDRNMWFCTSNGVSYFDGQRFRSIPLDEHLLSHVIVHGLMDARGRLWFCTSQGEFFSLVAGSLEFKLYDFNELVQQNLSQGLVATFDVKGDTLTFTAMAHRSGVIVYDHDSDRVLSVEFNRTDTAFYLEKTGEESYQCGVRSAPFNTYMTEFLGPSEGRPYSTRAVRSALLPQDDGVMVACGALIMVFDGDLKLIDHFLAPYEFSGSITRINAHEFWIGTLGNGAIRYRYDGRFSEMQSLLNGYQITDVFEDDEGGMWLATPSHGVFYFSDLETYELSHKLESSGTRVNSLIAGPRGALLSTWSNEVYEIFDHPELSIQKVLQATGPMYLRYFDAQDDRLYLSLHHQSQMQFLNWKHPVTVIPYGSFLDSIGHHYFLKAEIGIALLDSNQRKIKQVHPTVGYGGVVWVMHKTEHEFFVIGRTGVGIYDHRRQSYVPFTPGGLRSGIARISGAISRDDEVLLTTEGNGLNHTLNGSVERLHPENNEDPFTFSTSICAHPVNKNEFFVGTYQGLFRVKIIDGHFTVLQRYSPETGYPFLSVLRLIAFGDHLLVGCENRSFVTSLSSLDAEIDTTYLSIDRVMAGERILAPEGNSYHFYPADGNIEVHFHNHTLKNARHHRFRYRLPGLSSSWAQTRQSPVVLTGLAHGSYDLELETLNLKGEWASLSPLSLIIHPPWYRENWALTLFILLLAAALALLAQWRIHQIKKQTALQNAVIIATNKTLGAQLNPHFLYNVLNTVGGNLLDGSLENSLDTITKFSRLMRNVFANSQREFTSLDNELNALLGYVELEKMRLKESFDFSMDVDEALDRHTTLLPPLFLQPLLENAIWHGASKAQGLGRVWMKATREDNTIVFNIFDNGPGFRQVPKKQKADAKSSLDILLERIRLINRLHGDRHSLAIMPSSDPRFKTLLKLTLPIKTLQT